MFLVFTAEKRHMREAGSSLNPSCIYSESEDTLRVADYVSRGSSRVNRSARRFCWKRLGQSSKDSILVGSR